MSVLLLPSDHHRLLVQAAYQYRVKVEPETLMMLWRTNVESYAYRYSMSFEEAVAEAAEYSPAPETWYRVAFQIGPVQTLKAAQCYIYQISDLPNYRELPAFRWAEDLLGAAIAELPGYSSAEVWPFARACSLVVA